MSDLAWMLAAVRADRSPIEPTVGASADILAALRSRGACFRSELADASGRLSTEVDEGLWDLVARGLVTADAYSAVRSLLSVRRRQRSGLRRGSVRRAALGRRRSAVGTGVGEGRWSLLPEPDANGTGPHSGPPAEELAEAVAWQLLARWGVVAWELWSHESYRVPWRDVVRALRRLEARGQALGGRFVAGMSGEQYAVAGSGGAPRRRAPGCHAGGRGGGGRRRPAQPDRRMARWHPGARGAVPHGPLPGRRARRAGGHPTCALI